jgi:hypothetical protein
VADVKWAGWIDAGELNLNFFSMAEIDLKISP